MALNADIIFHEIICEIVFSSLNNTLIHKLKNKYLYMARH